MTRFHASLPDGFLDHLRGVLPGLTEADLAGFAELWAQGRVLADDGGAHPALVAWVQRILDRDAGQPAPVPVMPVPKTGPAGAEVVV